MTDVQEEYAEESVEGAEGHAEAEGYAESGYSEGDDGHDESERPEYDPEVVKLAKLHGWKEPDNWKGDTTNFMDPEKFLQVNAKRFQEELPQLRQDKERLESELRRLRQEVMERFQEQDQQSLAKLEAERDRAAEIGDMARYRQLNDQLRDAYTRPREQHGDPEQLQREHVNTVVADPVFQEFAAANPWLNDPTQQHKQEYASYVAQQEYARLGVANPLELQPELRRQVFSQISAKVNQFFPEQKANNGLGNYQPATQQRSSAAPRKKGPSFDALPKDAKDGFARWVRRGVYKDTPEDRLSFARDYARDNA